MPSDIARGVAALVFLLALAPRAEAQVSVRGSAVHEYAAAPGEVLSGVVEVTSASATAQTARVYLTDYTFDAAGRTHFDAPRSQPRSSAGWVTLGTTRVTVPAGGSVPVHYTVRVPADGALVGTYWCLIMLEADPGERAATGETAGLQTSLRYGVQVAASIGRTGRRTAEISTPRVVAGRAGGRAVEFVLRNAGERAYRPAVSLQLFDSLGAARGVFRESRGLLYPGTSLRQRFELAGVARGSYRAVILADAGDGQVFGADVALEP